MHKLSAEVAAVTGTVLARRLLENTRNIRELAGEARRSRVEMGPEGLMLHTSDGSDWNNPAEITIGPIPMVEAPRQHAAITTEANELALWAEHLASADRDDAMKLTVDAGIDRRPGQNPNVTHEFLTCLSMLDRTTVRIPGYRNPSTRPDNAETKPGEADSEPRNSIAMRTKCLLKLLSRCDEMMPDSTESGDNPIRLRIRTWDHREPVLETAIAGPYTYMIQTKPLASRAAEATERYIPWRTAQAWVRLTRGRPELLDGTTVVTRDAITTAPPETPGTRGTPDAAPFRISWRYADRCSARFPKLDMLSASHDDAASVTLQLLTHETARILDFVCRALENRKSAASSGYTADNAFVVWDFQANEVRALNDRLRMPMSRLCATHNRNEYEHLGPMELHAGRLRRIVDFWLRHGAGSTVTSHIPVDYFMMSRRIRIRGAWSRGRTTETTVQCSKPR